MAHTHVLPTRMQTAGEARAEHDDSGFWLFFIVAPTTIAATILSLILLRS